MPAVNLITALPAFTSQEEHKSIVGSTPNSFSDIPPVLRHQEEGVSIRFDPPVQGFTDEDGAQGTLFVITSVLAFMSATGRGFQIEYPAITLHAVSRNEAGPTVYCQLDEGVADETAIANEEEDTEMRELTIVPQNAASLERIFECLSACAALHPDKATGSDDEGPDDAFVDDSVFETFTGDEEQELSEVGRAALAHLESIIYDHDPASPTEDDDDENAQDGSEGSPTSEEENGEEDVNAVSTEQKK